jgi:hypothetical protein
MTIGINQFRESAWERLDRMLIQPFTGPATSYPIPARDMPERVPAGEPIEKDGEGRKG